MKAVILCAGKGKRLRPFSHSLPKHLLPVANVPVLQYLLEELAELHLVSEVGIIVSAETQSFIKDYIEENAQTFPFQFTYLFQDKPLGLADACAKAEKFVGGDSFVMLLGDNIIPGGLKSILSDFSEKNADATILVRNVEDPRPYGVVEFDQQGHVLSMEEKPQVPKSTFVIVGVYLFKPIIFSSIQQIKPSSRGELEITDAIFLLTKENRNVIAQPFYGEFLDIGNPISYLDANRYAIEHFSKVTPISNSSQIISSHISDNVSLGPNTHIENSHLTNCIVLEGSTIRNSYLKNSVIGRNCWIELKNQIDSISQLILGDNCMINRAE